MLRLGLILSTVLTATTITATNINNLVNQCTYIFPHKCNNNKKKDEKRERVCMCWEEEGYEKESKYKK